MVASRVGDVLLVGSIPFKDVETVLSRCSEKFGRHLYALPDGELGGRSAWIQALPQMAYVGNKDLVPIHVVSMEKALTNPKSHAPEDMKATRATFKVKDGVSKLTFDLPYSHDALKSYESFRRLRDSGAIPEAVRFQVCFPTTHAGTSGFFPDPKDEAIAAKAYNESIKVGLERMLSVIPANDLVIQWDYCTELLDVIGARDRYLTGPRPPVEERFARYTSADYLAPMTRILPDEAMMGFHLCYGTWGGWPIGEVKDLDFCVRLANALVANAGRRVDYLHLPVMPNAADAFFKPLRDLKCPGTKVFLGIELADGVDAMCSRAEAARKYLSEFGVSHYCGYGREDETKVVRLMNDLKEGAERLA